MPARWSCSTRSAPGLIRPRARRSGDGRRRATARAWAPGSPPRRTTPSSRLRPSTRGVTNASVEFDVRTLRPDVPARHRAARARSQAFAIAQRLGLPEAVLADARRRLSAEHVIHGGDAGRRSQRAERERGEALERAAPGGARAAAAERERARSGVSTGPQGGGAILGDARRAADELLARAEREVAEVRREVTRQRNLAAAAGQRRRRASSFDRCRAARRCARGAADRAADPGRPAMADPTGRSAARRALRPQPHPGQRAAASPR